MVCTAPDAGIEVDLNSDSPGAALADSSAASEQVILSVAATNFYKCIYYINICKCV